MTDTSGENIALGYLRAFLVVLVVAFHAAIPYTELAQHVPAQAFGSRPYYWGAFPIVDSHHAIGFDIFFALNDNFFMALFFFLAGLYVWPSLERKGVRIYLHDRWVRLGVPFLVMEFLLGPITYYAAYSIRTPDGDPQQFMRQWLALDSWPGPGWFLALLLAFCTAAAAAYRRFPLRVDALGKSEGIVRSPARFFFALATVSMIAYVPMRLAFGPAHWSASGPFSIQTSRLFLYALYFSAGLWLGARGLRKSFLVLNTRDDRNFAAQWRRWFALAFVCLMTFLVMSDALSGLSRIQREFWLGVAVSLSCAASSFCLLACFLRFAKRSRLFDSLANNAYGIFVSHYFFVTWLAYFLQGRDLSPALKFSVVFLGGLALSCLSVIAIRHFSPANRVLPAAHGDVRKPV